MKVQVQFPTGGRLYKAGNPITIRTITGAEEKLMAEINSSNVDQKLVTVLGHVSGDLGPVLQGISPDQLTIGDRRWCLQWLLVNCYSQKINLETACDRCGKPGLVEVDVSKLSDRPLSDEYVEPFVIDLTGKPVQCRLRRVSDDVEMERDLASKKKLDPDYSWAQCIVGGSFDERMALFASLSPIDRQTIRGFHAYFDHGPVIDQEWTCACETVNKLEAEVTPDMFFPDHNELVRRFAHAKRSVNPQ